MNVEKNKKIKIPSYIGQRLRHLRTDQTPEISIEEMAKIAKVSSTDWASYEKGVIPDEHIWVNLQKAGFDIGYVLTGELIEVDSLKADEVLLLGKYRQLDVDAREALTKLASYCATANEVRYDHPLTEKKRQVSVRNHNVIHGAIGVLVENNNGTIHHTVSNHK